MKTCIEIIILIKHIKCTLILRTILSENWRDGSIHKSTGSTCRGLMFEDIYSGTQMPVILILEDLMPFSDLYRDQAFI